MPSELQTRQWKHIDFGAGWLRLEPGETKNGEARMFPLTADLRAVLEDQRKRTDALEQGDGANRPVVFWRVKGPGVRKDGQPVGSFRKAWMTACVEAGLGREVRDEKGKLTGKESFRLAHDFRRTAVRNLERALVPRSVAMKLTGHKTENVYRRYAIVPSRTFRKARRSSRRCTRA